MPAAPTAITCAVLTGALVAGCGSSVSKDDYISRGDAICKQTNTAQAQLKAPAKGDLPATARYLTASAALVDKQLVQLRKLAKPSQDKGRLGDLLGREGDAIATLRKAADAARRGEQASADALFKQGQGELSDVAAGLTDFGFTVCGT